MSYLGGTVTGMGLDIFHPWRRLRALDQVAVEWTPLRGRHGETNGVDLIWLHPDQLQVERRVSLTHELVHLERGHTGACDPIVEGMVRAETARRLISIEHLLDALTWTEDWEEAADHLWVTVEVLEDRIKNLTSQERDRLTVRAREMGELR